MYILSLLEHKEHHGKRVHSAPALSCSTASLTFVSTTELSGLLSMAQHVICRSLSSGRGGGGGAAKAARGRHFIRDGGGAAAPPPPPPPRLCWIRGWIRHVGVQLFQAMKNAPLNEWHSTAGCQCPVQIKAQLPYTTAEDLKPVKSYSSAQQNVDRRQKAEVTPQGRRSP